MLIIDDSCQAKFYDLDGFKRGECAKGDMYMYDTRNTKGHTARLIGGHWHPLDAHCCLTGSEDGTLRLWDANKMTQKTVIKPIVVEKHLKSITSCCYSPC